MIRSSCRQGFQEPRLSSYPNIISTFLKDHALRHVRIDSLVLPKSNETVSSHADDLLCFPYARVQTIPPFRTTKSLFLSTSGKFPHAAVEGICPRVDSIGSLAWCEFGSHLVNLRVLLNVYYKLWNDLIWTVIESLRRQYCKDTQRHKIRASTNYSMTTILHSA